MSADVVLVEQFLRLLSERVPDDLGLPVVSIRRSHVRLESAAVVDQLGHAVGRAAKLAGTHDLYVAPGGIERTRLRQLRNVNKRGGRADVSALAALWLDVDLAGPTHAATNLPTSDDDAQWIVDQLPPASLVLRTGGGWQCWWLLDRPLDCRSTHRLKAQRLSQSWHRLAQLLAGQRGWHVDDTSDLARILRISGTRNHKHAEPRLVVPHDRLWRPELRYHADDLAAFVARRLPALETEPTPSASPRRVQRSGGVLDVVDALDWSRIWPRGWQRVADVVVDGVVCERWRRPGAASSASATCWPTGGCQVHSSAVPGLAPGPHSRADVLAWSVGVADVRELVAELRRREQMKRRDW